jgi:hypothetical protein
LAQPVNHSHNAPVGWWPMDQCPTLSDRSGPLIFVGQSSTIMRQTKPRTDTIFLETLSHYLLLAYDASARERRASCEQQSTVRSRLGGPRMSGACGSFIYERSFPCSSSGSETKVVPVMTSTTLTQLVVSTMRARVPQPHVTIDALGCGGARVSLRGTSGVATAR